MIAAVPASRSSFGSPSFLQPELGPAGLAELPDRALLVRFVERRDEAAFAVLVERYGPLVAGAGRRTVCGSAGAAADADDALQATFLSLARNAPKLIDRMGPDRTLGGWLYRVAVNAVLQAKRSDTARRRRERTVAAERGGRGTVDRGASPDAALQRDERLDALEEELASLSATERGAVVLCHLRGRTQRQAAEELGVPFGTFRRRLDAARGRLRERLEARGVTLGAVALTAMLADLQQACAGALHGAEAAAIAGEVTAQLPPPHVLPPRVAPSGMTGPRPVALSWEPILTSLAGLAVGVLALVGLFDLLGGGFSEEPAPVAAPFAVQGEESDSRVRGTEGIRQGMLAQSAI
ncbi:MAG: sigma-70 family RNA polymerase sigma factor [Planctomycetota bacterium]